MCGHVRNSLTPPPVRFFLRTPFFIIYAYQKIHKKNQILPTRYYILSSPRANRPKSIYFAKFLNKYIFFRFITFCIFLYIQKKKNYFCCGQCDDPPPRLRTCLQLFNFFDALAVIILVDVCIDLNLDTFVFYLHICTYISTH